MLNKVIIMGRLGKSPELNRTPSGTAVTSFSLAVDRDFKGQSGERETDWIDVVAWRGTAEFVSKYFTKGRVAVVEGRLQTRKWRDKDGNNRVAVEVVAENVYFGDSKRDTDTYTHTDTYADAPAYGGNGAGGFAEISEEDEELPF